jgi:tetratricopeptide (TPR) repeat protein
MRTSEDIEKLIKNAAIHSNPDVNQVVLRDLLKEFDNAQEQKSTVTQPSERRIIMKSPITKLAVAAVIIVAVALSITVVDKLTTPAYAIVQTVEALKNARFLHIIGRDDAGQINDERWIEIGMHGLQVRYRQDKPPHPFAIEDGESTARYRHDKKAVVIYDRKDLQYQWVGELGKALENLRQEGEILKANDDYQGQLAHKVWWPYMSAECYVNPETKLPIAIGDTELSYEVPPAEIFEIFVPEGYVVVDKRPGAPAGSVPDWLLEEERVRETASECFHQATRALANNDYAKAAELFEVVTERQSGRNWAWFWLGSAYYGQGQYELAIEKFNRVFEIFGDNSCTYCNYARGLAYAQIGMDEAAQDDLQVCLFGMIQALRTPSAATMFEYADNPLMRYGKYIPTKQQIVINMINRLRIVSGQNFGYNPKATDQENEAAITAWEQWLESDGRINVTFDAELVGVPAASELPQ